MCVKERLIEYIKYKGVGQNKFAESIGVSSGYVNNIRKSIQPDKIFSISKKYPDLNTGWLLTGEGTMLRKPQSIGDISGSTVVGANVNGSGNTITNNDVAGLIELQKGYQQMLKEKDKQINKSQEQIDRLLSIIENSTKK